MTGLTASADDLFFNNLNGGSGTWEPDAGGTPWFDLSTSTFNVPWSNTQGDIAHFQGAGGTVDVAADVSTDYMVFNASSDETLNGTGTITVVTGNGVLENDSNNNVTINNNLQLDDSQVSDRFDINDGGANTVTLNGNISYVGSDVRPSGQALIFNGGANTNFVLNGSYSGSAQNPGRLILSGGTMHLNGDYTNSNPGNLLELDFGTVYLGTSKLGTGGLNIGNGSLLTAGAQHVTNAVVLENIDFGNGIELAGTVGGSTADVSHYSGGIGLIQTELILTAADGGRVDIDGAITGQGTGGIVKTGLGTVVLNTANTNSLAHFFQGTPDGTVAASIQKGTLLINNQSGSAFGNNTGTVNLAAGATLGGTGIATQTVVAAGATSVLTAGDPGQANLGIAPSIGFLNLGGLTASNGLTMDFKLNGEGTTIGVNNDFIQIGNLTLGGIVTINLSAMDALLTGAGNAYNLFDGDVSVSGDPIFNVIAPTGYALDTTYGLSDGLPDGLNLGYDYDNGNFTVELVATPEPSTYGLMGLGLLALVAINRWRKLRA